MYDQKIGIRYRSEGGFSAVHCVHIGAAVHIASSLKGTIGSFKKGKAFGACSWSISSTGGRVFGKTHEYVVPGVFLV